MKYNNHLNYQKRKKIIFRTRLVVTIVLVLLIVIAGTLFIRNIRKTTVFEPVESGNSNSVMTSSVNILRSPYFQFQAPKGWVEIPNESTPSKFVYRSLKSNLIEHELIIYVNQIPANLSANHVLPVKLMGNNFEMMPSSVSEHCIQKLGGRSTMNDTDVIMDDTKLKCNSDSTNYTVMVGQVGGGTSISMSRPDKSQATYAFYYTNLRAVPDATEFTEIIKSFQAR